MASAFYRIHDRNIHAMHLPGGPVYNLIDKNAIEAAKIARVEVGKRTLKLHNSIRANHPNQSGGFAIAALVYANAKHAHWHHEGTMNRKPKPKRGRYMTVPRWRGSISGGQERRDWMGGGAKGDKPYFLAQRINGQDGNPYLRTGMEIALARDPHLTFTGI